MHAKPDLRVVLEWMIAGSGSVIADVIRLNLIQGKEMSDTEIASDVELAIQSYEVATATAATRTRNMIAHHGETEALSRLMLSPDLQAGFKALRDNDELDKTFESIVVRFRGLFAQDAVAAAEWRLENAHNLLT